MNANLVGIDFSLNSDLGGYTRLTNQIKPT